MKLLKKAGAERKIIIRLITALLLFAAGLICEHIFKDINKNIWLSIYLPSYIIIGYDIIWKAIRNIKGGKIFDENFLMVIATIGAFVIGEYPEAVAVMLFYQAGELFQRIAVMRSRKSIADLMDIRPDYANLLKDGQTVKIVPDDVKIGDFILIKAGEKVPLDGIITEGSSTLNTAALTGESLPSDVMAGDKILSGSVNLTGVLTVKVEKTFGESTVSKILDLVENAASSKSQSEKFITKFARYYTPSVVIIAFILAILPPLITGLTGGGYDFAKWVYRALTFLVISCPCALVISIPLSFFGGLGGASKKGILIKGSNYLENLSKTQIAVFDKTGTLTKGVFKVQKIVPNNIEKEKLLRYAAYAEAYSAHPIAVSLKEAYNKTIASNVVSDVKEIAGKGVECRIDNKKVLVGNGKLMSENGTVDYKEVAGETGTVVNVAVDSQYKGYIVISDEIKPDSKKAIDELKSLGIKKTVMLTGDNATIGHAVVDKLGLDEGYYGLLPVDKVNTLEKLMREKRQGGKLIFVGDGINDAPVLARSDIGVAMGGLGSDAAIEAADMVIMTDEPSKIATAVKISKKTLKIVYENIIFSLVVKFAVLILGALGYATMWEAVFADVGVAVIAILNAIRMLNDKL